MPAKEYHQRDQQPVTGDGAGIDAIEQPLRLGRVEDWRLSGDHDVPGPAHRVRWVDLDDLAGDQ